jgi:hypothetical protein
MNTVERLHSRRLHPQFANALTLAFAIIASGLNLSPQPAALLP